MTSICSKASIIRKSNVIDISRLVPTDIRTSSEPAGLRRLNLATILGLLNSVPTTKELVRNWFENGEPELMGRFIGVYLETLGFGDLSLPYSY